MKHDDDVRVTVRMTGVGDDVSYHCHDHDYDYPRKSSDMGSYDF